MSQFRDAYGEFRHAGVEVAAISVDSPYSHRAWATELEIPYPLLSDFGREFMVAYGVPERTMRLLPRVATRSAWVIDAAGTIRYIWWPVEGQRTPPVEGILQAVRTLLPA